MLFIVITLVVSLLLTKTLIAYLIQAIQLIEVMTGLPQLVLGMTVMAIGNSIPDLAVDTALSAQGLTTMAITGIFSGQMFNFLVGFSLTCILKTIG